MSSWQDAILGHGERQEPRVGRKRRSDVRLVLFTLALALAACDGESAVSPTAGETSGGLPAAESAGGEMAAPDVETNDTDAASTTPSAASIRSWACDELEDRYLGQGLTAAVAKGAIPTGGSGTADLGPVHAAIEVSFGFGPGAIVIGRRVGSEAVAEPLLSQRIEGDVIIYVRADDDQIRECVLASVPYDRAQDERD